MTRRVAEKLCTKKKFAFIFWPLKTPNIVSTALLLNEVFEKSREIWNIFVSPKFAPKFDPKFFVLSWHVEKSSPQISPDFSHRRFQISNRIRLSNFTKNSPCRKRGEAKGDRQKSDQNRQKRWQKGYQKVTETEKKWPIPFCVRPFAAQWKISQTHFCRLGSPKTSSKNLPSAPGPKSSLGIVQKVFSEKASAIARLRQKYVRNASNQRKTKGQQLKGKIVS